jgi:hypothetical protein
MNAIKYKNRFWLFNSVAVGMSIKLGFGALPWRFALIFGFARLTRYTIAASEVFV